MATRAYRLASWTVVAIAVAGLAVCDGQGGRYPSPQAGPTIAAGTIDWAAAFDHVFPQDRVVQIRIDFDDPAAYAKMLAAARKQPVERPYYSATFTFDGEVLERVGVRLKGNSSLRSSHDGQMKSFKIHFEEYVNDRRFHQVDRLSLNNNFKDPSIMRERLAFRMANEFAIEAPRTAYAQVWVDGQLHGVRTMVQQVDHRFLRERFGERDHADDGNLYKCYRHCSLEYRGEDPSAYAQPGGCADPDECGLTLKTNEDDQDHNDHGDLVELVRTIHQVRNGQASTAALEAVFDMKHYIRFQAWNLVLSNFDSFFGSTQNFYLYHRRTDGRFQFIPWDVNEAYGLFGCWGGGLPPPPPRGGGPPPPPPRRGGQPPPPPPRDGRYPPPQTGVDLLEVDLLSGCGRPRPLMDIIVEKPAYLAQYCSAIEQLLGLYTVTGQDEQIAALHALVAPARAAGGALGQPPANYSYEDYVHAQSHLSGSARGPGGTAYSLGYFNDVRLANVAAQYARICGAHP